LDLKLLIGEGKNYLKSIIKYEGREHFLYRLPVVYYLMNKPKLAKGFILKELKKLGDTHPWDLEYKEFAERFLEYI